jgi:hypothetical protein
VPRNRRARHCALTLLSIAGEPYNQRKGISQGRTTALALRWGTGMNFELYVALAALIVSLIALGMSFYFWRLQFRPIVTAMVKTNAGGNEGITYDLVLLNSGSIPARDIRLEVLDLAALDRALGSGADQDNKKMWLACFDKGTVVPILHNGDRTSCSFGATKRADRGFWKHGAEFPIRIRYTGWFGDKYPHEQTLRIADSDSFTGYLWGK